jgi:hypothetical protein
MPLIQPFLDALARVNGTAHRGGGSGFRLVGNRHGFGPFSVRPKKKCPEQCEPVTALVRAGRHLKGRDVLEQNFKFIDFMDCLGISTGCVIRQFSASYLLGLRVHPFFSLFLVASTFFAPVFGLSGASSVWRYSARYSVRWSSKSRPAVS